MLPVPTLTPVTVATVVDTVAIEVLADVDHSNVPPAVLEVSVRMSPVQILRLDIGVIVNAGFPFILINNVL